MPLAFSGETLFSRQDMGFFTVFFRRGNWDIHGFIWNTIKLFSQKRIAFIWYYVILPRRTEKDREIEYAARNL